MRIKHIGNNLIFKHGEIICKDGQDLQLYLKKYFKEDQEINIIDHKALVELNEAIGYTLCA